MGIKGGRFNREEIEFIAENADKMSVEQMARHLNRSYASVRKYAKVYRTTTGPAGDIDDEFAPPIYDALQFLDAGFLAEEVNRPSLIEDPQKEYEAARRREEAERIEAEILKSRPSPLKQDPTLRDAPKDCPVYNPNAARVPPNDNPYIKELRETWVWKNLLQEFSLEEILYFEERFIALCSQFKNDIMPSEQSQIFNTIKVELLMSRNLRERRRCRDDVVEMERQKEEFVQRFNGDPNQMTAEDRDYLMALENQMTALRSAEQTRTTEYVKLSERHGKLLESLKGTRDQRIKEIESSNQNWIGVIKKLQDGEAQEREGRRLELMKLAAKKERDRLGRPVLYEDGNQDNPILTPETVTLGPAE